MGSGLLVGAVMTVGCAIWICAMVVNFVRGRARLRSFVRVPGTIVDVRHRESSTMETTGTAPSYAPVLAFRTLDGRDVRTESQRWSNMYADKVGSQVQVIYDPQDPTEAYIGSATGTPLFVYLIAIAIAAIGLLVGLAILSSNL